MVKLETKTLYPLIPRPISVQCKTNKNAANYIDKLEI